MGEQKRLMKSVVNLSCIWHRVLEQSMSDMGLSSIQSRILGHMYFQALHQNHVFQRDLEEEFQIRKSSVTSVLQILEKKGLVTRIPVQGDARQKELVLTEKGKSVQETVLRRLDKLENMAVDSLTPEEQTCWFSCMHKIETRLKEADYD